jgi:hypothetical protein
MKTAPTPEACDAKTLAVIAAQFIARGDDEQEALRKANALYFKASEYAKRFASLSAEEKAFEVDPETALREAAEGSMQWRGVDLAIGDSEATSPALEHFRATAKSKLDKNITHKKFVEIVTRHFAQRVEEIGPSGEKIEKIEPPIRLAPSIIEHLHILLRDFRSRKRGERRKKNRTRRGP